VDTWPELLATGQVIEASKMSERLGISARALDRAIAMHRLFQLEYAGKRYVPAFFADRRYERAQLEGVCRRLGTLPGGAKWRFFTTPKGSLNGRTPLQALLDGEVAKVRVAAAGFASN
jgi:hypothetical protein